MHCRFYDPEKPAELGDLIRYYLKHEEERERIAMAGLEEVRRNFSLETRLAEILSHLGKPEETHIPIEQQAVAMQALK